MTAVAISLLVALVGVTVTIQLFVLGRVNSLGDKLGDLTASVARLDERVSHLERAA